MRKLKYVKLFENFDLTDSYPTSPHIGSTDPRYIKRVKMMLDLLKGERKISDDASNFSKAYEELKKFSKTNNILKNDIIDFFENELIIKNIDNHDKEKGINLQYHFLRKNNKFMDLINNIFQ